MIERIYINENAVMGMGGDNLTSNKKVSKDNEKLK